MKSTPAAEREGFVSSEGITPGEYARFRYQHLPFIAQRAKEISSLIRVREGTILEIGAGSGLLILELSKLLPEGFRYYALDFDPDMIKIAREFSGGYKKKINFILGDACSLNFRDNSFDVIINEFCLHHARSPENIFKELYRVLKPNGFIRVYDFNPEAPFLFRFPFCLSAILLSPVSCLAKIRRYYGAIKTSLLNSYDIAELNGFLKKSGIDTYRIETKPMTLVLTLSKR